MEPNRMEIRETLKAYWFGGTIDEAIANLNESKTLLRTEHTRHEVVVRDFMNFSNVHLHAYRPETDAEMAKRVETERARDAAEFERLKAKLGM